MQPGQFKPPNDESWMVRKLQELERTVQQLAAANVFGLTGIRPKDGGTDLDGFVNINGDATINGPLEVNGESEFNGSLSINGPLNLQPGSIQNDALTNPVEFFAGFNDNDALTITLSETNLCTFTVTIPDGFSRAFIVAYGSIGIMNPTGANSSIGGRVYIDRPNGAGPTWGPRRFQQANANADASTFPFKQTTVTGLSGGQTITCRLVGLNTGPTDWGATVGGASLNVSATFTR